MTVLDCPAGCPARRMGCHSSCNRYKLAAIIRKRKRRRSGQKFRYGDEEGRKETELPSVDGGFVLLNGVYCGHIILLLCRPRV